MTEKIKWYKEVLELEPNSKVFFPLARMLAEEGMTDEAVAVLENGLERHPEYLEARLFIIELLYTGHRAEECAAQVNKLSKMFSSYAGFWQAWAACLSQEPSEEDTASLLRFLAANFISGPLKLHDVINRGLAAIAAEKRESVPQAAQVEMKTVAQSVQNESDSQGNAENDTGFNDNILENLASGGEDLESPAQNNQSEPLACAQTLEEPEAACGSSMDMQDEIEVASAEASSENDDYALDEQVVDLVENESVPHRHPDDADTLHAENQMASEAMAPAESEMIVAASEETEESMPQPQAESSAHSLEDNVAEILNTALAEDVASIREEEEPVASIGQRNAEDDLLSVEPLEDIDLPETPDLDAAADFIDIEAEPAGRQEPLDEDGAYDAMIDSLAEKADLLNSESGRETAAADEQQLAGEREEQGQTEVSTFVDAELDGIFDELDETAGSARVGMAADAAPVVAEVEQFDMRESLEDKQAVELDSQDDPDEKISLRTRSMAEVLAEQGDIQGALDIYHELASTSVDEQEAEDIKRRITTLKGRLEIAEAAEARPETLESKRLIGMLESLAQRVEARVAN